MMSCVGDRCGFCLWDVVATKDWGSRMPGAKTTEISCAAPWRGCRWSAESRGCLLILWPAPTFTCFLVFWFSDQCGIVLLLRADQTINKFLLIDSDRKMATAAVAGQPKVKLYWYITPLMAIFLGNIWEHQARAIAFPTYPMASRGTESSLRTRDFPPKQRNEARTGRAQESARFGEITGDFSQPSWLYGIRYNCGECFYCWIPSRPLWKWKYLTAKKIQGGTGRQDRRRNWGMAEIQIFHALCWR